MSKLQGSVRQELLKEISSNGFQHPRSPSFWHGRTFSKDELDRALIPPRMTWESPQKPRDDHCNHSNEFDDDEDDPKNWLTASEYQDEEASMNLKIEKLAQMLQQSKKTVVYSGAGISVAAGIGQAARGSHEKHPIFGQKKADFAKAKPTPTHHALGALAAEGLVHGWVQQNHDGLPQKAGFPQERINEIHGSWFDPSNPVVVYSGSLRDSEYKWMVKEAKTADLVLVLGTSLSGLNADQVALDATHRSVAGSSLGMVIINLQQTPHDGKASLRIFGPTDEVFLRLLRRVQLKMPRSAPKQYRFPANRRFLVPYNARGELYLVSGGGGNNFVEGADASTHKMVWDLSVGAKVRIVNHNVDGAGQPSHKPVLYQNPELIGKVAGWDDDSMSVKIDISGTIFRMGYWWIETAIRGRAPTIPSVNVNPTFAGAAAQEQVAQRIG